MKEKEVTKAANNLLTDAQHLQKSCVILDSLRKDAPEREKALSEFNTNYDDLIRAANILKSYFSDATVTENKTESQ